MLDAWLAPPTATSAVVFLVGWCAGWIGFLRATRRGDMQTALRPDRTCEELRQRPTNVALQRSPVTVVIPSRNEEANLAELLPSLGLALHPNDEVVVVDDHSSDDTARIAERHGMNVIRVGALPIGWAGKPHACWLGAQWSTNETVVFMDADVRLGRHAVDHLVSVLDAHPTALVSVMPWHRTGSFVERFSMLFNVISSMVASMQMRRGTRRVAYGPLMAVRKDEYLRSGGHAHENVRGAVVEDLALARVMPASVALLGREGDVEYRMYPGGWRQLLEGWTKNTALGAVAVPRWSAVFIIPWVASLCGGVVTSPWLYLLSALQVWVFARRVGNFGVLSSLMYPLHATVFVVVALYSAIRSALAGSVSWRGRSIATR